jgi:uncharacterized protein YjbJ (UPF0337 family)
MPDNTSTVQSIVDSATGAAKSLYGSVVGNNEHQAEGDAQQKKGQAEYDASHATAKLGPVAVTGSGVATDSHDRTDGSWNQTMGSAKQAIGGLVGSQSLKQAGDQQYKDGKAQEAKGRATDYAAGAADRVTGAVGGAISRVSGNTEAQSAYEAQHDTGKTQQRGVERDVGKELDAKAQQAKE